MAVPAQTVRLGRATGIESRPGIRFLLLWTLSSAALGAGAIYLTNLTTGTEFSFFWLPLANGIVAIMGAILRTSFSAQWDDSEEGDWSVVRWLAGSGAAWILAVFVGAWAAGSAQYLLQPELRDLSWKQSLAEARATMAGEAAGSAIYGICMGLFAAWWVRRRPLPPWRVEALGGEAGMARVRARERSDMIHLVASACLLLVATIALTAAVTVTWNGQAGNGSFTWGGGPAASPALSSDGTMFRADLGRTGAYSGPGPSRPAGTEWQFQATGRIQSSPVLTGGAVYIGSDDSCVYSLDTETGKEMWRFITVWDVRSSPAIAGSLLFVASGLPSHGKLYAIEAANGRELWTFDLETETASSPVVASGVVYIGDRARTLYAVDATTGLLRWKFKAAGPVESGPAVSSGLVFFASTNGTLYALDTLTGAKKWQFKTGSIAGGSGPAVSAGVVFLGSEDGYLHAVEQQTGKELWRFATGGTIASSPAAASGLVLVASATDGGSNGYLHAVDAATGQERWKFHVPGGAISSPIVAGGAVYFGQTAGNNGRLYSVDALTGTKLWEYPAGAIDGVPLVAGGRVYLSLLNSSSLYALR